MQLGKNILLHRFLIFKRLVVANILIVKSINRHFPIQRIDDPVFPYAAGHVQVQLFNQIFTARLFGYNLPVDVLVSFFIVLSQLQKLLIGRR
jgi:hypothetical protein